MSIVELTKENFETEVLGAKVPVIIDFWASWCQPCMMQSPIVDEIAEEMDGKVKVCKVNVDEQPYLAMQYQIASIPTLVFMQYGICKKRLIGFQSKNVILEELESVME